MNLRKFLSSCTAALVFLLSSCNDRVSVLQAYDFGLSTWFLQDKIAVGETVEIRFTLWRGGD